MRAHRPRVAVAVDPRLLSDALSRALTHRQMEVVDVSESIWNDLPEADRHFPVALVSSMLPPEASADVVIVLPDGPGASRGAVRRDGSVEPVALEDLDAIVQLVDRFCGL